MSSLNLRGILRSSSTTCLSLNQSKSVKFLPILKRNSNKNISLNPKQTLSNSKIYYSFRDNSSEKVSLPKIQKNLFEKEKEKKLKPIYNEDSAFVQKIKKLKKLNKSIISKDFNIEKYQNSILKIFEHSTSSKNFEKMKKNFSLIEKFNKLSCGVKRIKKN